MKSKTTPPRVNWAHFPPERWTKRLCLLVIILSLGGCQAQPTAMPDPLPPTATTSSPATPAVPPPPTQDGFDSDQPEHIPAHTWEAALQDLAGQSLSVFLDESYKLILLRNPERITEEGLGTQLNVPENTLTNLSEPYIAETDALYAAILNQLNSFDDTSLTPAEKLSKEIYTWYLKDLLDMQPYHYHDYPVTFFITSVIWNLETLFGDLHKISDQEDAEAYVQRLQQVDEKIDQLITGLEIREAAGIVPPRFVFQWTNGSIQQMARNTARNTVFYKGLEQKMMVLSSIHPTDQAALLAEAETIVASEIIPAYQRLLTVLQHQESIAGTHDGVWRLPDGETYYRTLLRHYTTTDMSPEAVYNLGIRELDRIHREMRLVFDELGYPAEASIADNYQRAVQESGYLYNEDILPGYQALIREANQNLENIFTLRPSTKVVVEPDEYGGYYVAPAVDGSRPGIFFAAVSGSIPRLGMPTLAYHETVPGHHLQIGVARDLELPMFQNFTGFDGFVEGWALYAERLAWELGWYEEDVYGNLGRLQGEAFRAARLVVDTGIHAKGWTFDQAVDFMVENTGYDRNYANGQIARYIVWPGQSTAYMIGMLKILELRQVAMDQLGDQFELDEFHTVILQNGSLPLDILEQVVASYILDKQGGGG